MLGPVASDDASRDASTWTIAVDGSLAEHDVILHG